MENTFIDINMEDVLGLLGRRGAELTDELAGMIEISIEEAKAAARPIEVIRSFELVSIGIVDTNLSFDTEDLKRLLRTSHSVILLAVTLGTSIDELIRRLEILDMAKAVVMDSIASTMVESYISSINKELNTEYRSKGLYLTDRFSPGYGDVPLEFNRRLCDVLGTEKNIGVKVSSSGLMIPRKSITAIIGVSNIEQPKRAVCDLCSKKTCCKLKEEGRFCGKEN